MTTKHSTDLINPHGRLVQVATERVATLLKAGFKRPPSAQKQTSGTSQEPTLVEFLRSMTKPRICDFGFEEFDLDLDTSSKKEDLIAAILEAAK